MCDTAFLNAYIEFYQIKMYNKMICSVLILFAKKRT